MSKKVSVIIKEPGKAPRHVHISDSLKNLQATVGGYIEAVTLAEDLVILCDEEGRLKGKERCCEISGVDFCGTIVLIGADGEEFCDLPYSFDCMKLLFPALWLGVK